MESIPNSSALAHVNDPSNGQVIQTGAIRFQCGDFSRSPLCMERFFSSLVINSRGKNQINPGLRLLPHGKED